MPNVHWKVFLKVIFQIFIKNYDTLALHKINLLFSTSKDDLLDALRIVQIVNYVTYSNLRHLSIKTCTNFINITPGELDSNFIITTLTFLVLILLCF